MSTHDLTPAERLVQWQRQLDICRRQRPDLVPICLQAIDDLERNGDKTVADYLEATTP